MARVSKQFLEAYKPLSTKELKDPVIFVVDMIEGFVHEGAQMCIRDSEKRFIDYYQRTKRCRQRNCA